MQPRARLARSTVLLAGAVLLISSCSTGGSDASKTTSTTKAPTTTEAPTTTDAPTTTEATTTTAVEETDGGVVRVGDKFVFLDGFIGVEVPTTWDLTSTDVPTRSDSPPGETEMDPDALSQALVLNPAAAPRDATFALIHYEHSDAVPDLEKFSVAAKEVLSGDGSQIGDGQEAQIGGQPAMLHQVRSSRGQNGLMVTLETGGEFFILLTLAQGDEYPADVASMLSSVTFEPAALHD